MIVVIVSEMVLCCVMTVRAIQNLMGELLDLRIHHRLQGQSERVQEWYRRGGEERGRCGDVGGPRPNFLFRAGYHFGGEREQTTALDKPTQPYFSINIDIRYRVRFLSADVP